MLLYVVVWLPPRWRFGQAGIVLVLAGCAQALAYVVVAPFYADLMARTDEGIAPLAVLGVGLCLVAMLTTRATPRVAKGLLLSAIVVPVLVELPPAQDALGGADAVLLVASGVAVALRVAVVGHPLLRPPPLRRSLPKPT